MKKDRVAQYISEVGHISITRVRKQPTKAQKKKLLLAFFAAMERVIREGDR